MQAEAPEAFDVDGESRRREGLYGIGEPATDIFGRQCLMARRLVERGVRVRAGLPHADLASGRAASCGTSTAACGPSCRTTAPRPTSRSPGCSTDLKARGLLEDTLVLWGGEFGRTPTAEGTDGREHHPFGFTMWLAGGGVKGGIVHGATDEFGWHAVEDKVHVHDLHATILHLMGLDHEKLTYRYGGRDYRLTDVHGNVVKEILA